MKLQHQAHVRPAAPGGRRPERPASAESRWSTARWLATLPGTSSTRTCLCQPRPAALVLLGHSPRMSSLLPRIPRLPSSFPASPGLQSQRGSLSPLCLLQPVERCLYCLYCMYLRRAPSAAGLHRHPSPPRRGHETAPFAGSLLHHAKGTAVGLLVIPQDAKPGPVPTHIGLGPNFHALLRQHPRSRPS